MFSHFFLCTKQFKMQFVDVGACICITLKIKVSFIRNALFFFYFSRVFTEREREKKPLCILEHILININCVNKFSSAGQIAQDTLDSTCDAFNVYVLCL